MIPLMREADLSVRASWPRGPPAPLSAVRAVCCAIAQHVRLATSHRFRLSSCFVLFCLLSVALR